MSVWVSSSCQVSCFLEVRLLVHATESHTGAHISSYIDTTLAQYEMLKAWVSFMTSDNGANVVLASELSGIGRLQCGAHTLNLFVLDVLKVTIDSVTRLLNCEFCIVPTGPCC
jgi:hypothetical protein